MQLTFGSDSRRLERGSVRIGRAIGQRHGGWHVRFMRRIKEAESNTRLIKEAVARPRNTNSRTRNTSAGHMDYTNVHLTGPRSFGNIKICLPKTSGPNNAWPSIRVVSGNYLPQAIFIQ